MRSEFLAVLLAALAVAPASAGQLNVDIKAENESVIGDTEVEVDAPDLAVERRTGNRFTYTFADPNAVTSPLTLEITSPPEKQARFNLTFNAPFFWAQGATTQLAAALVPAELGPKTAAGVMRDGSSLGTMSARILTNQRSRVAFRLLRQEFDERAPSSDDAKVALIFVRSSKELGYHDFVEPDDEMMSAVDWLQGMIADATTAKRLFPTPADLDTAKETLRQFALVDAMQRQSLVDAVAKGVGSSSAKIKQDSCQRAYGLNDYFLALMPAEGETTVPSMRREIQNLTNVAICKWRELPSQAGADADLVTGATAIRDQMVELLAEFTPEPDDCGIVRFARARTQELEQRLVVQNVEAVAATTWAPDPDPCARP